MTYIISTDTGEEYVADGITRAFLGEKAYIPARWGSYVYFLNPDHVVSIKKTEPVDRPKVKGECQRKGRMELMEEMEEKIA